MNDERLFTDDEIAAAFRMESVDVEPSESHFETLRSQLLDRTGTSSALNATRTGSASDSSTLARRRLGLSLKIASIAATIVIFIITTRIFVGTAAAGFKSALDATRHSAWIHAATVVTYLGESTESESWCSPHQRIAATRSSEMLHFVNYEEGVQSSYSSTRDMIYRWRADKTLENFGRTFVQILLSDGDLSAAFPMHRVSRVERSNVDSDGSARIVYSFGLELKSDPSVHSKTVVQAEQGSGRIVSWEERHSGGMRILTTFDYPESGPQDIYQLGASRNAKVVDRVASSDIVELAEQFQQYVYNFGNYDALVIDWLQSDDNTLPGQPLLRRLRRSGRTFQIDLLTPLKSDFNVPLDADLTWWQTNQQHLDSTSLAACDGETCVLHPVSDSRLDIATEMSPRIRKETRISVLAVINSAGSTTVPVWPSIWPEYACRPMLMTTDPTLHFDIDPAGSNGPPNTIRLRLLTPDSPFTKERASYWLALDHQHCVVKSNLIQPDFEGSALGLVETSLISEYTDFMQSPNGTTFATRRTTSETNGTRTRMTRYIVKFDEAK